MTSRPKGLPWGIRSSSYYERTYEKVSQFAFVGSIKGAIDHSFQRKIVLSGKHLYETEEPVKCHPVLFPFVVVFKSCKTILGIRYVRAPNRRVSGYPSFVQTHVIIDGQEKSSAPVVVRDVRDQTSSRFLLATKDRHNRAAAWLAVKQQTSNRKNGIGFTGGLDRTRIQSGPPVEPKLTDQITAPDPWLWTEPDFS